MRISATRKLCRHCGTGNVNRPKGLCWSCYCTPGVRELYPSTSKFCNRGVPDQEGGCPPPSQAASGPPKSEAKLVELERRAGAGESLWHPEDAKAGD